MSLVLLSKVRNRYMVEMSIQYRKCAFYISIIQAKGINIHTCDDGKPKFGIFIVTLICKSFLYSCVWKAVLFLFLAASVLGLFVTVMHGTRCPNRGQPSTYPCIINKTTLKRQLHNLLDATQTENCRETYFKVTFSNPSPQILSQNSQTWQARKSTAVFYFFLFSFWCSDLYLIVCHEYSE